MSALQKLLQPFDLVVWMALLATLIMSVLVILMIHFKFRSMKSLVYGTTVQHPFLNMLAAIFGISQSQLPRRNFPRFLLTMFLILCLVLRNSYQGALFSILQSDGRGKEIQTINEMIAKNFDFYIYESHLDIARNNPDIFRRYKSLNKSFLL